MTIAVSPDGDSSGFSPGLSAEAAPTSSRLSTPWALLGTLFFGHLALDCCTGIWPVYKTLAHLDLVQAGVIATLGSLVGNGLQVAFGLLADRGWRRVLLLGGLCTCGAVTAVSLTDSALLHLLLVITTFVGSAAFHPAGAGAAGGASSRRKGTLVAVFLAGGYVGYAFSQLVFTSIYRMAPGATVGLCILPLLAALATHLWVPKLVVGSRKTLGELRSSVTREAGRLVPLLSIQLFSTTMNLAVVFLLPDLLHSRGAPRWLGEGGGHAALVFGGCFALLPSGYLADRWGPRWVLVGANLLAGAAMLLLTANLTGGALLVGAIVLFGLFNGANSVVVVSEGNRIFPKEGSAVSGLLMGLPWCVAAISPAIAGALADPSTGGTPGAALAWMGLVIPFSVVASALVRPALSAPR